jgi:hypothetical protein
MSIKHHSWSWATTEVFCWRELFEKETDVAIQWDASWTQSRRYTVEGALGRITRMLTKSYLSVRAVQRAQQARGIYVQHFADAPLTHLYHVTNVIKSMHDRVTTSQVLRMSYVPDLPTFNALGVGPLPAGVLLANVEAFVIQRDVAAATPLTVYIGPSFFTGNVYLPNAVNQRTGTGTILHELSHGVAGTDDHAYTWQASYANLSAVRRTRNADSYRAFCQSFDM